MESREFVNEVLGLAWSMSDTYTSLSPFKALFDDEYDRMFVELYSTQETETI
jgi:hypothetical protein